MCCETDRMLYLQVSLHTVLFQMKVTVWQRVRHTQILQIRFRGRVFPNRESGVQSFVSFVDFDWIHHRTWSLMREYILERNHLSAPFVIKDLKENTTWKHILLCTTIFMERYDCDNHSVIFGDNFDTLWVLQKIQCWYYIIVMEIC